MAVHTEPSVFDGLDPEVAALEFKVTVLKKDEAKVRRMLAGATPVPRTVYFYDTPELALYERKERLVLRARVTAGKEQSTVKLRPVTLPAVKPWSEDKEVEIEADVVGKEAPMSSAKLDGKVDPGEIDQVARRKRELSKLFNKAQEALIAPTLAGIASLDDLKVLGPIEACKWELQRGELPCKLEVEEWRIKDGPHFIELSIKVDRDKADEALPKWSAFFDDHKIRRTHKQVSKTRVAMEHFAQRLRK